MIQQTLLSNVFKFQPLDRIQINNKSTIKEMSISTTMYGIPNPELPFLYFQRVLPNGMIEARSPGGTAVNVDVMDICDVIKGEPVIVRAMTKAVFIKRLSLTPKERNQAPNDEDYSPAFVLWASKDKWGRAEPRVWFLDESLNDHSGSGQTFIAPIHQDDIKIVQEKANRNYMPVSNYRSASNCSADKGISKEKDNVRLVVKNFISGAINHNTSIVEAICNSGLKPVSLKSMNKLLVR